MVKCKNCGAEIPDGEVVCPICGAEVQLVPDYDGAGLDPLPKETAASDKPKDAVHETAAESKKRMHPARIALKVILGVLIAAGLFCGFRRLVSFQDAESYSLQKKEAERLLAAGNANAALAFAERAEALRPASVDIRTLKARILGASGDNAGAEKILKELIKDGNFDDSTVSALADLYIKEGSTDSVAPLLYEYGSDTLMKSYSAYISEPPSFSLTDGNTYAYGTKLVLSGAGTIYYTTDGTEPDEKSYQYTSPIILPEGEVTVKAICINENGIVSDPAEASYTVTSPSA